jgi:hypothetical protein
MKWVFNILALLLFASAAVSTASAQTSTDCPTGKVCIDQVTANQLFNTVEQLIAAKDTIAKMLQERGASDAAIASALKTIEGWKNLDEINNTIILKQKDVIALYEKVITMYQGVVEKLEKQLNKPKSAWQKFVGILKTFATILSGIAIGRAL